MKDEVWKPITWIEGIPEDKYSISNYGFIRNNYTQNVLKNYVRKNGTVTCLISNSPCRMYRAKMVRYTLISNNGKNAIKTFLVTIAVQVAKAFLQEPRKSDPREIIEVIHKDGNKTNNYVGNLEYKKYLPKKYINAMVPKKRIGLTEEEVRKVCMMLVEEKGILRYIRRRLPFELPTVKIEQVEAIKYKMHYRNISDDYFTYDEIYKFQPLTDD